MARRTDTVSVAKRSEIMSAVRSSGNISTEMVLMKLMRAHGITGWRRHVGLRGNPDFVFVKQRTAIFVDGCFWHGCRKHCRMPHGNREYWQTKIAGNKVRDAFVTCMLRRTGWNVLRVWEHELALKNQARLLRRLSALISGRIRHTRPFPVQGADPARRFDV